MPAAKLKMGLGEARLDNDRLFITRGRILQPAEFRQHISPIEAGVRIVGLECDRMIVASESFSEMLEFF